jgi:hypothetical protein
MRVKGCTTVRIFLTISLKICVQNSQFLNLLISPNTTHVKHNKTPKKYTICFAFFLVAIEQIYNLQEKSPCAYQSSMQIEAKQGKIP